MTRIVGWLAGAVAIFALVLSSVGIAVADEPDEEGQGQEAEPGEQDEPEVAQTFGIHATGHYGTCFSVVWNADPTRVIGYTVKRPAYPPNTPARVWDNIPPGQDSVWACEMEPGETYEYEVCSVYGSKAGDTGCATANLTLVKTGNLEPGGPLPIPKIDPPPTSPNNFGVGWKGFYDFDFYYVDVLPKGGKWNQIKHDDDGDWGWQRVEVIPGTTYTFRVRGCVSGIFSDPCSGWSPEATVTIDLPYGPDTCKPGFVWRDGVPSDHICVTPERRQKVADDLNTGKSRMKPRPPLEYTQDITGGNCGGIGQKPSAECFKAPECLEPYVPRDIPGENVVVCVDQKEADLIKQENANPTANRVQS